MDYKSPTEPLAVGTSNYTELLKRDTTYLQEYLPRCTDYTLAELIIKEIISRVKPHS